MELEHEAEEPSEEIQVMRCSDTDCAVYYHPNYKIAGGAKTNTVCLDQVDVLFVSNKLTFAKDFLEYHEALHSRVFFECQCNFLGWLRDDLG